MLIDVEWDRYLDAYMKFINLIMSLGHLEQFFIFLVRLRDHVVF